jgi:hypothetical protein
VHEQHLAGLDPTAKSGDELGGELHVRRVQIGHREPHGAPARVAGEPRHVVRVAVGELRLLAEAHRGARPGLAQCLVGIRTDEVLAAEPEPAGDARQRDAVGTAVARPLALPVDRHGLRR